VDELDPEATFPKGLKVLPDPGNAFVDVVFVHGAHGLTGTDMDGNVPRKQPQCALASRPTAAISISSSNGDL